MLSVTEAFDCIMSRTARGPTASRGTCHTKRAQFGYSAQRITADRDLPPFDRVAMDGIAIRFASYDGGRRQFHIAGMQAAGAPPVDLSDDEHAVEVMTGAVLPNGTDTVVRYEDLKIAGGAALIMPTKTAIYLGQNIHQRGSDRLAGDLLIAPGDPMHPPQWAVAATVGCLEVMVPSMPHICVIGTGDELVDLGDVPLPHQIRASNIYAIAAALRGQGFANISVHLVKDDPEELVDLLAAKLEDCDACILTGAVSAGKFDHVPATLKRLGVTEVFHKINQRPGKPMWYGETKRGVVFGLPGNPVSSLICCYRYVIPWIGSLIGRPSETLIRYAELTEAISFANGEHMTLFAPVKVSYGRDAKVRATPVRHVGSGDLGALLGSDGFVECPAGKTEFLPGETVSLYLWGH